MTPIDRRSVLLFGLGLTAGCVGNQTNMDPKGTDGQADAEFDSKTNPEGTLKVSGQEGQGHQLHIQRAHANVDYLIVINYDGTSMTSDPISAGNEFSSTVDLENRITTDTRVDIAIVSADGDQLTEQTIQYLPKPPGPELTTAEAKELASDKFPLIGAHELAPWHVHLEWYEDEFIVDRHPDGHIVELQWLSGYDLHKTKEVTEQYIAGLNARFFEQFYASDYEIYETRANVWLLVGHNTDGSQITEHCSEVILSQSAAEQIDWDNFVEHADFPEGLRQVADTYRYQYYKPIE